ncbi:MAG TPA: hypothetical protein VGM75_17130, partial [Pseudonocardiaceae bacterium]
MIMIGAGALLISALTAPAAVAVAPAATGPDLAGLRDAVHSGTLSQTHGVHAVCAGATGGCQAQFVTTSKT